MIGAPRAGPARPPQCGLFYVVPGAGRRPFCAISY